MSQAGGGPLGPERKKKRSLPDFASWVERLPLQASEEDGASKPFAPDPGLYLVSTPIGNLGDITLRALWTLASADAILCEDTRTSGGMLQKYGIKKPLISCHDHNEAARAAEVLQRLDRGEVLALISDAGTPMISDPGYRLAMTVRDAGHAVIAIPGASALLTALASAGLPTDQFFFAGFLPSKQVARRKEIARLAGHDATLVFYESPQRLADTLGDLAHILSPDRKAAVGRELTKLYEEMRTGSLGALAQHYAEAETPKGEIVILIGPPDGQANAMGEEELDAALKKALESMSLRDAVAAVTEASGLKKSVVYQRALAVSQTI